MQISSPLARRAKLLPGLVLLLSSTMLVAPALAQTAGQRSGALPGSRANVGGAPVAYLVVLPTLGGD